MTPSQRRAAWSAWHDHNMHGSCADVLHTLRSALLNCKFKAPLRPNPAQVELFTQLNDPKIINQMKENADVE